MVWQHTPGRPYLCNNSPSWLGNGFSVAWQSTACRLEAYGPTTRICFQAPTACGCARYCYPGTDRERSMAQVYRHGTDFLGDRKSTRLNSSHVAISYAVLCL